MGPRRSQRARTLKNDAMSANDTNIEKTGRAGDRERRLIREWLAYPETTFKKKKAAELLPDIETWAQLNCSDWESLELNVSMIGMILQLEHRGLDVKRAKTGKKAGSVCGTVKRADLFQQLIEWHDNPKEKNSGNFGVPAGKIPRTVPKGGREKRKWARSLKNSTAV